jgi:hypothetical protein
MEIGQQTPFDIRVLKSYLLIIDTPQMTQMKDLLHNPGENTTLFQHED